MRWIFVVLVLVNVGILVWHSVESSRVERMEALNTASGGDQGVISGGPLILVSELTEKQLTTPKPVAAVVKEASPAVVPAVKEEISSTGAQVSTAATAVKVVAPVVSVEPASGKTSLVESNQCSRLGPATNAAQAEQVSQRLLAFTIITDVIDVDVPGKPEYWVILPPFSDEKAALQKMQELQGRSIQAQIIPKGDLANAISFGLHGLQEDANKQAEELNAKGFKVIVKALPVIHKEKWLALNERQAPKLTDELWQGIHADFPKLDKQIKNCH